MHHSRSYAVFRPPATIAFAALLRAQNARTAFILRTSFTFLLKVHERPERRSIGFYQGRFDPSKAPEPGSISTK